MVILALFLLVKPSKKYLFFIRINFLQYKVETTFKYTIVQSKKLLIHRSISFVLAKQFLQVPKLPPISSLFPSTTTEPTSLPVFLLSPLSVTTSHYHYCIATPHQPQDPKAERDHVTLSVIFNSHEIDDHKMQRGTRTTSPSKKGEKWWHLSWR